MKPRVTELDVREPQKTRAVGDAPKIGKVTKVSQVESKRRSHRRKRIHSSPGKLGPTERVNKITKILSISALVLVVLLVLVVAGFRVRQLLFPEDDAAVSNTLTAGYENVQKVVPKDVPLAEEAALDLVRRGLATRNTAKVGEYFRISKHTSRDQVVAFLQGLERMDGLLSGMQVLPKIEACGRPLGRVLVTTNSSGEVRKRLALLVVDKNGAWKIDFGAFAIEAQPSWNLLLDGTASEGLVRVVAGGVESMNFNGSDWQVWRLSSHGVDVEMFGYCRMGSAEAAAMDALRPSELYDDGRRVTMVISQMAGKGKGHFKISRVISEDWVLEDGVYENGFEPIGDN